MNTLRRFLAILLIILHFFQFLILPQAQAAPVTLVQFNFEDATKRGNITDNATFISSSYTADDGIAGNVDVSTIALSGGPVFNSWVQGSGGAGTFAPNADQSWASGSGTKYWEIQFSTEDYENLTLSSKLRGSSTGPRDFKVQYSTGGGLWTDVPSSTITVANDFTTGVLNGVTLPSAINNQATVYLRWIMTSDTSIGGGSVGAAGTSRIDDIVIQGDFIDVESPVVTLTGSGNITLEVGTAYTELGATWTDNVDGTGSILVANTGSVDINTVGDYTLQYSYTDIAGNPGNIVSRIVEVVDTTLPIITLIGSGTISQEALLSYTDSGAIWSDNYDGTGSLTASGTVITNILGLYPLTYHFTDSSGNIGIQAIRNVTITSPTCSPGRELVTSTGGVVSCEPCQAGRFNPIAGGICLPAHTGYYVPIAESTEQFFCPAGTFSNNVGASECQSCPSGYTSGTGAISCNDVELPVITLVGSGVIDVEYGTTYTDLGATWSDNDLINNSGSVVASGSVDTNNLGIYTLTYDYTDGGGNAAIQVTRTVNVVDTTSPIPVITSSASGSINTSPFVVTVTFGEEIDGIVDGDVTVGNGIVDSVILTSTGVYDVQITPIADGLVTVDIASGVSIDLSGNENIAAIQFSIMYDGTPPAILLTSGISELSNDSTPEFSFSSTEGGILTLSGSCTSSQTGAILGDNTITVNTLGEGTYTDCSFTVTDIHNNESAITYLSTFTVDTTAPGITVDDDTLTGPVQSDDFTISITDLNGFANVRMAYSDDNVCDVTDTFTAIYFSTPATFTVNNEINNGDYLCTKVTDNAGNITYQISTNPLNIDVTLPVITRLGDAIVTINVGDTYTDSGSTANDNYDGDITGDIVISGDTVDTNVVGPYIIRYDVTDTAGNNATQVTRTVNVVDAEMPVITLNGTTPINIEVGTPYIDAGATASDNYDGDITGDIVIGGDTVDTDTVGSYTITYDVSDGEGNDAIQVERVINVVDTTSPVITLVGSGTLDVYALSLYTDSGATWSDNYDGSGTLDGTGVVDINNIGTYYYTYDYTDISGNDAIQVTRTINVIAPICPAGTELSMSGTTPSCTPCAAGKYNSMVGGTCEAAPVGSYVSGTGATETTMCSPGSYANGTGSISCELAPLGNYVSGTGASTYDFCGVGTYADVLGLTSCLPAPAGRFVSGTGASIADVCAIGTYSSTPGSSSCTLAPLGSFVASSGSTSSQFCAANTFSSVLGSSTCTACASGTSSSTGASSCSVISTSGGGGGGGAGASKVDNTVGFTKEDLVVTQLSKIVESQNTQNTQDAGDTQNSQVNNSDNIEEENLYPESGENESEESIFKLEPVVCEQVDIILSGDISEIDTDDEIIERFTKAGVVALGNRNFEGERNISRAEYLKILFRTYCISYENVSGETVFEDVPYGTWESKVIEKAYNLGIINGQTLDDGTKIFRPSDSITKAESMKMLLKVVGYKNPSPTTWENSYIQQALALGISSAGEENSPILRTSALKLIFRVISISNKKDK